MTSKILLGFSALGYELDRCSPLVLCTGNSDENEVIVKAGKSVGHRATGLPKGMKNIRVSLFILLT